MISAKMEEKKERNYLSVTCRSDMSGMHIASIYRNRSQQMHAVLPYVVCGLQNNKKCLYITSEKNRGQICSGLEICGLDYDSYIQSGQLVFMDKAETYLKDGFFAPFRMLDNLEYSHYETLKNGYRGLRGAGEMDWAAEGVPGSDKLLDYEVQLNNTLYRKRLSTLCQYEEPKFPEELLLRVLYTHPKVIIYGELYDNPFYIPPERFEKDGNYKYRPGYYQELRDRIIAGTVSKDPA